MNPSGTELGAGTTVGGGLPGALSFASPGPNWTCTVLLPPDRSGWTETWDDLERRTSQEAIVGIGDEVYEATIGAAGTVDPAVRLDVGDDDSVGGPVVHVWIRQAFDADGPIGWQVDEVLVSAICLRGTAGELCV